ncbi:MAG: NDP-sugar synthase [Acidobacteria bacterium]|nr:NDP-sugar synthase [Acidobacteriota bacterium]
MKALLLAGGFGTRLRPLTLNTPKPIVPIFDRPFLYHQIELLRRVPEVDEVILSLNYHPERIEAVVGRGDDAGLPIRYVVEPQPLGTGGAVKFAEPYLDGTTIVFNGDVLTETDLAALVEHHRTRGARATIVLAPVEDPTRYGLVETDGDGNVTRFLEKPDPAQVTCNTINAGIYVLEPDTFDRIPADTKYSIERRYFPSLVERGEAFAAYVERGYWLDIGTPAAYRQAHRDILDGRCRSGCAGLSGPCGTTVSGSATVSSTAGLRGPCFIGPGVNVHPDAGIGPHAVLGSGSVVGRGATIRDSVVWPDSIIGAGATLDGAIVGHRCRIGGHAHLGPGLVLGDDSVVTAHTRFGEASTTP